MEPLDAVVKLTAGSCEIWAGDQFQTMDQGNAAKAAGLDPQQVTINTLYAGGSFGRRANVWSDYIGGSRLHREGLRRRRQRRSSCNGLARTICMGVCTGPCISTSSRRGLNEKKELVGWRHVIVGQSIMAGGPFEVMVKNGIDPHGRSKALHPLRMRLPNIDVEPRHHQEPRAGAVVARGRELAHHVAVETFIDEVAYAAGKDPLRSAGICSRRNRA